MKALLIKLLDSTKSLLTRLIVKIGGLVSKLGAKLIELGADNTSRATVSRKKAALTTKTKKGSK